jgi:N-acetylglucosamine transport system substrate-binding protein
MDGAVLPFECGRNEAAEAFIVPAKAENVAGGMEFMRLMLSKEGAAEFTKLTAAPSVVNGATEGVELTPGAESAISFIEAGGENNWNYYYAIWYTPLDPLIQTAVGELAAGRISGEEFCQKAQDAADEIASDPNTQKRTRA